MANLDPPEEFLDQAEEGERFVTDNDTLTPAAIHFFEQLNRFNTDTYEVLEAGDAITNITNVESFETSSSSAEYHQIGDTNAQIEDLIPSSTQTLDQITALEQIEDFIPTRQEREFLSVVATSSYTAIDRDFIDIRNGATVTFDPSADYNAQIITANGDGSTVKVFSTVELRYKGQRGNTVIMRNEGTTLHWHLFETGTERFWRPR